jgi:hypothetical protein
MQKELEPWEPNIVPQDMQDALAKFNAEAKRILDSSLGYLASVEPPTTIYHYTNDAGLRGILESGQLWLTDVFDLNDPSELNHGFSQAIKVLNSKASVGPPESRIFAERFEAFAKAGYIQKIAHFFVCSFSAHKDDLGQWRAYADNGRGYAMAFDAKTLEQPFVAESIVPKFSNGTFPVLYDDKQLTQIYDQLINEAFPLISLPRGRNLQGPVINSYMSQLDFWLTYHALQAMLYFKHEAYKSEEEYRFLQIHRADEAPAVKFRQRPYSLVRYREFDWKSKASAALRQIVVGPSADRQKAPQFASACVREFHGGDIEVIQSEIPCRSVP